MTAAGEFRHRVTLLEPTTELDALGQTVYQDGPTVWGSVQPLRGREFWAAQQVGAETTIKVRIRYRAGVTSAMRVRAEGRVMEITAVIDPELRHRELELMCREVPGLADQGGGAR